MTPDEFYASAGTVADLAYVDTGSPAGRDATRTALFLHGVGTSSYLWRHVIAEVSPETRCVALDLPLHGRSQARPDLSLGAVADVVEEFCAALGLTGVDLVANDTGGAIAQIFAARHPERLRTFTLTNCDTHDNIPPEAFKGTIELAAAGELAPLGSALVEDPALIRTSAGLGEGFERPELFDDATVNDYREAFVRPVFGTMESARRFEQMLTSMGPEDLLSIEDDLRRLNVPTLVVWGTGDVFFDVRWAYWLLGAIPGATEVVELEGAKLFFPDQRAGELVPHLRRHWAAH
ncbi:alpha/beta fold hydrolase [Sphaerisporangium fuscum]|uniref:alpha/beta fold hydrolase n=1 Tax=Sphaerisporangium fuscum TaxID=2835868 RepID=UPI001BDC8DFD|nr:alpha/beta hydrolase [Sphaerisporangium fuscum]